jgi:predicted Zn-dependent protease
MGDAAGAEQHMRTLVEQAPEQPRPYLLLARIVLKTSSDFDEVQSLALSGLERTGAAELKALGYYLLADVYSRQGRRRELQDVLEKAQYYRAQIGSG